MRKLIAVMVMGFVLVSGVAFANEEVTVPVIVTTVAERYVVNPARFAHRFSWGVLAVAYRIGKAPVDAAFKLIGQTLGTEPNTPLWE
mgnify:CR=1 FL=1